MPPTLIGSSFGPYRVLDKLGEGGMGQVYRARDERLGRDVAIKVLPDAFTADPERLARFEREARTLAALSHPHIAAIYGLEQVDSVEHGHTRALVLELIEGETLAERLRGGPLDLRTSLVLARQIADALDAAHEKGIVHRDLKPANVMLQAGRELRAKVLDFGLAKVDVTTTEMGSTAFDTIAATRDGMILGTAAYMSPEQARGHAVDKRTDVWAFACVLYEMLIGKPAFVGATTSDLLASVLTGEPDWAALPAATPAAIRRLLQRALQKDANLRPRDIGDLRGEIDHELTLLANPARPSDARKSRTHGALIALTAVLSTAVVAGAVWIWRAPRTAPATLEPAVQLTNFYDAAVHPAISPDGRWLTFIRSANTFFSQSNSHGDLFVKMLSGSEPPLQLTHDGTGKESPVFSPDGSRIVYTNVTNGFRWDSWEVGVLGQTPPHPFMANASGLVWLGEHQLLYSETMEGEGVHMKIATSSETKSDHRDIYVPRGEGSMAHRSARSPDGKSLLLAEMDGTGWLPCRLLPFDGSSVGTRVGPQDGQCITVAWSPDRRWMYFTSNAAGGTYHLWRQQYPAGAPEQITFPPAEQEGTTITSDGRYVITSQGLSQAAIWFHDADGERQITTDGFAMLPSVPPSGNRMFYLLRAGPQKTYVSGELWSVSLTTGEKQRLLPGVIMSGYSITNDGRRVIYTSSGFANGDGVWVGSLDPDSRTPPRQLTRGSEFRAFAAGTDDIVYMDQADVRHLYRMKEDGSGVTRIADDAVTYLIGVSPDGRWAAATTPQPHSDGSQVLFFSTRGEKPYYACECSVGFGPARFQSPVMGWGLDGKSIVLSLRMYGLQTQRSVILPYDSRQPFDVLWPKGIKSEAAVMSNPGARVVNEGNVFPVSGPVAYLAWRQVTQANLWKIPLPK